MDRIILPLSDGEDTSSLHTIGETIAIAQRREIQIYAVSIHHGRALAPGDLILRKLAEDTGGQLYVAAKEKRLPGYFSRNGAADAYAVLRFIPSRAADSRPSRSAYRDHQQQAVRIHARQGYYFDRP